MPWRTKSTPNHTTKSAAKTSCCIEHSGNEPTKKKKKKFWNKHLCIMEQTSMTEMQYRIKNPVKGASKCRWAQSAEDVCCIPWERARNEMAQNLTTQSRCIFLENTVYMWWLYWKPPFQNPDSLRRARSEGKGLQSMPMLWFARYAIQYIMKYS